MCIIDVNFLMLILIAIIFQSNINISIFTTNLQLEDDVIILVYLNIVIFVTYDIVIFHVTRDKGLCHCLFICLALSLSLSLSVFLSFGSSFCLSVNVWPLKCKRDQKKEELHNSVWVEEFK